MTSEIDPTGPVGNRMEWGVGVDGGKMLGGVSRLSDTPLIPAKIRCDSITTTTDQISLKAFTRADQSRHDSVQIGQIGQQWPSRDGFPQFWF